MFNVGNRLPVLPWKIKSIVFGAVGLFLLLYAVKIGIVSSLFLPEPQLAADDAEITAVLNKDIETEVNLFPMHVQSGYVHIGEKEDLSTYTYGDKGKSVSYLEGNGFKAEGIYRNIDGYWKRVTDIKDLNENDAIVITLYVGPSRSDSGETGKTYFGIIDGLKRERGRLTINFLDDPSSQSFEISKSINLKTEDTTGVYRFGDDLFEDISRGDTLRLLVDNQGKVIAATLKSPRMSVAVGRLIHLRLVSDDKYEMKIEGFSKPFYLNSNTQVVSRDKPQSLKPISEIPPNAKIHVVYYNRLNNYIGLSLDFN